VNDGRPVDVDTPHASSTMPPASKLHLSYVPPSTTPRRRRSADEEDALPTRVVTISAVASEHECSARTRVREPSPNAETDEATDERRRSAPETDPKTGRKKMKAEAGARLPRAGRRAIAAEKTQEKPHGVRCFSHGHRAGDAELETPNPMQKIQSPTGCGNTTILWCRGRVIRRWSQPTSGTRAIARHVSSHSRRNVGRAVPWPGLPDRLPLGKPLSS
jgi:hypothetical protein